MGLERLRDDLPQAGSAASPKGWGFGFKVWGSDVGLRVLGL